MCIYCVLGILLQTQLKDSFRFDFQQNPFSKLLQ
jgi:hypothetical protein